MYDFLKKPEQTANHCLVPSRCSLQIHVPCNIQTVQWLGLDSTADQNETEDSSQTAADCQSPGSVLPSCKNPVLHIISYTLLHYTNLDRHRENKTETSVQCNLVAMLSPILGHRKQFELKTTS